jgi:acetyltransferase
MMERTKIYEALKGVRGRAGVDLEELEQLIVRFSQLIAEQRWVKELDINPLIASPDGLLALDARVLVFGLEAEESALPQLAIRPYPTQYVNEWTAKDGSSIVFRPIRAEDEPLIVKFHETLSDRSVYLRYMHPMMLDDRAAHERLSRICHCDYDREITMVADKVNAEDGALRILGALRITKIHGTNAARFSVLVSDQSQGMGIGSELMNQLIPIARDENLDHLEAIMTPDNRIMQGMCAKLGFSFSKTDDGMIKAELEL